MDAPTFLAKVDGLLDFIKRQADADSIGEWALDALKEEIRRRLLDEKKPQAEPFHIHAEVGGFAWANVLPSDSPFSPGFGFTENPFYVLVHGMVGKDHKILRVNLVGVEAVRIYLAGLEAASKYGFKFTVCGLDYLKS